LAVDVAWPLTFSFMPFVCSSVMPLRRSLEPLFHLPFAARFIGTAVFFLFRHVRHLHCKTFGTGIDDFFFTGRLG
jgi:hypothetical protein